MAGKWRRIRDRDVVYGDVFKSANVLESKVAGDVTGCP
jgi:hypothetical protein